MYINSLRTPNQRTHDLFIIMSVFPKVSIEQYIDLKLKIPVIKIIMS